MLSLLNAFRISDCIMFYAVCLQEGSGRLPVNGAREVCQDRGMRLAEAEQVDDGKSLQGTQWRVSLMELWLLEASRCATLCVRGGGLPYRVARQNSFSCSVSLSLSAAFHSIPPMSFGATVEVSTLKS
jgi:hypothetical protein